MGREEGKRRVGKKGKKGRRVGKKVRGIDKRRLTDGWERSFKSGEVIESFRGWGNGGNIGRRWKCDFPCKSL